MPITGGTRMLRARRKDCNVKPNRRLDRKSSRGMLYENEELRMRTITINAEVEQGQHALKKLRRENEQLRREMWSLRDEYDKMEKLLRKKETDEDSNQENSDSEENQSQTDNSDDEKLALENLTEQQDESLDADDDNHLKPIPENESNVRSFDGLSVIDEQTEETQTTESPLGCGTSSRGNSEVNPTLSSQAQMYDEACGLPDFPQFEDEYARTTKPPQPPSSTPSKRKSSYENGHFPGSWPTPVCDAYESRPASPYPYNGSLHHDSYRKRFQVLQNLSPMAVTSAPALPDHGWILPDSSKSTDGLPGYEMFVESGPYLPDKPVEAAPVAPLPSFPYDLIQDRTGPDVFVSDGYPQGKGQQLPATETDTNLVVDNLEAKLDGVKIGQKTERDPKIGFAVGVEPRGEGEEVGGVGVEGGNQMTTLTKSVVSRDAAAVGLAKIPWDPQRTPDPAKLTIDESPGENDNNQFPTRVRTLVSCQNPFGPDVRDKACDRFAPENESKSPLSQADEMPQQTEKSGSGVAGGGSKYQTKLTVTLRTPTMGRAEGKKPLAPAAPSPSRTFHQTQAFRYGIKPEYATMRFQTFPNSSPGCQQQSTIKSQATDGKDCLVNHYAGIRTNSNGLSGSLPRLPALTSKPEIAMNALHIPVNSLEKELDVLPDEETLPPISAGQLFPKPVKIPPVPPPRTSSYPKQIIPGTLMQGNNLVHARMYRQGKPIQTTGMMEPKPMDPIMYNPLLLSQPIATSSPTISLRMAKSGGNSSTENLYLSRFQRQNYYDESSNEDLTRQKSKFRDEITRAGAVGGRKLNKSLSSPSFETFRSARRKPTDSGLTNSVENIHSSGMTMPDKSDKKPSFKGHHGQSNVSVSSSSGLDSPVKSDRRKRRVSIQFKKKQQHQQQDGKRDEEKESTCSRHNSLAQGLPSTSRGGGGSASGHVNDRLKPKGKVEETDATTSERERTNSISSRTSSLATGSGSRRKFSTSSNRTYLNDEKIPWCGCWGNGCI